MEPVKQDGSATEERNRKCSVTCIPEPADPDTKRDGVEGLGNEDRRDKQPRHVIQKNMFKTIAKPVPDPDFDDPDKADEVTGTPKSANPDTKRDGVVVGSTPGIVRLHRALEKFQTSSPSDAMTSPCTKKIYSRELAITNRAGLGNEDRRDKQPRDVIQKNVFKKIEEPVPKPNFGDPSEADEAAGTPKSADSDTKRDDVVVGSTPGIVRLHRALKKFQTSSPSDAMTSPCTRKVDSREWANKSRAGLGNEDRRDRQPRHMIQENMFKRIEKPVPKLDFGDSCESDEDGQ